MACVGCQLGQCCCEAQDKKNPINSLSSNCNAPLGCTDLAGQIGGKRVDGGGCGQGQGGGCDCCCPLGCSDLGCGGGCCCAPRPPPRKNKGCDAPPLPCCNCPCDKRAHHLNRSPYCCPCRPGPDPCVYRCCEGMVSSYAGHVPGFTFHSLARPYSRATFGTKQYMECCLYHNTWSKI